MNLQENFAIEVKTFIKSCCKQRLLLLRKGSSKISDDGISDIAKGMLNDIDTIFSDTTVAKYFIKKSGELLKLIPGKNCVGIDKRMRDYNTILFQSQIILNQSR